MFGMYHTVSGFPDKHGLRFALNRLIPVLFCFNNIKIKSEVGLGRVKAVTSYIRNGQDYIYRKTDSPSGVRVALAIDLIANTR